MWQWQIGEWGPLLLLSYFLFFMQVRNQMRREFVEVIEAAPVIAAVKDDEGLKICLTSEVDAVFILYGDICTIADIVAKVKDAGKIAMVHMDLITGEIGLATVLRYFVLDSMALVNIERQSRVNRDSQPDMIEILPGVIVPKMIRKICSMSRVPVICGGLIQEKEDVMNALSSGAAAISTTSSEVWFM